LLAWAFRRSPISPPFGRIRYGLTELAGSISVVAGSAGVVWGKFTELREVKTQAA
jgi:hypothetical protein